MNVCVSMSVCVCVCVCVYAHVPWERHCKGTEAVSGVYYMKDENHRTLKQKYLRALMEHPIECGTHKYLGFLVYTTWSQPG